MIDDPILVVSHFDFDGVVCQLILAEHFSNITFKECGYGEIDQILSEVKPGNYRWVFITDISPKEFNLDLIPNSILLDHHATAKHLHCPERYRFVDTKAPSGAEVVAWFLHTYLGLRVAMQDELLWYASDYDTYVLSNWFWSVGFNALYRKLNHWEFRSMFTKVKPSQLSPEWVEYIGSLVKSIQDTAATTQKFPLGIVNGVWIWRPEFGANEVAHIILDNNPTHEESYCFFVGANRRDQSYTVSVRHSIADMDAGAALAKANLGGGHAKAAGSICPIGKDLNHHIAEVEAALLAYSSSEMIPF